MCVCERKRERGEGESWNAEMELFWVENKSDNYLLEAAE